jgi:hypothetical protein
MEGEALVLIEERNGSYILNQENVKKVFLNPNILHTFIAIISVTGNERRGKSTFLNYLLRFANNNSLEPYDSPLEGFLCKTGRDAVTKGIFVWSKPFIRKLLNGREAAVFFLDSQGTFGKDNINDGLIFGICAMASSLQIYNVQHDMQLDRWQQIEAFLRNAYESVNGPLSEDMKLFQHLVILIRDYQLDYQFGFEGGERFSDGLNSAENAELAKFIQLSYYEPISYCSLPHPGGKIHNPNFNGSLKVVDQEFVKYLEESIRHIIDNLLSVKIIGYREVTGEEFYNYFIESFNAIQNKQPLMPMVKALQVVNSNKKTMLLREIYSNLFTEYIGTIKSRGKLHNLSNTEEIKKYRNDLLKEAELNFVGKSKINTVCFEEELERFKNELYSAFDALEKGFYILVIKDKIEVLKKNYKSLLQQFVDRNRYLCSFLWTTNEKLKEKDMKLKKMFEAAFEKYPNLKKVFDENSVLKFDDELTSVKEGLSKKKKNAAIAMGTSVLFGVAGGLFAASMASSSIAAATASKFAADGVGKTVVDTGAKIAADSVSKTVVETGAKIAADSVSKVIVGTGLKLLRIA